MRVCCTANASSVGPTNDKEHGGMVGVLKTDEGKPSNLNVTDFLTSWNSTYMRNVRKQMLNGEQPPSCAKCYKEEAAGHRSKRQWETEYWMKRVELEKLIADTRDDGSVPPNLAYIDLRFGTKCQLACVMCSPHDSSGWIKEWKDIYPNVENPVLKQTMMWENKGSINGSSYNWHKQNDVFWEQFYEQIPNMQQLYFAGGEPLIIEEHYEILRRCIAQGHAKNLEIRYNSNGIEWKDDLFDLWKEFKLVRYHFSVDDVGVRNEYIRYPSNWNRIIDAFKILDQESPDNVEVTIACAVQALNVYYLPDFMRWKLENKFKKINKWPLGAGGINVHFVYHPPHLNVKVLPKWFKQKCREKYEEFFKWWEANWELCLTDEQKGKVTFEQWRNSEYGIKRMAGIISFMESEDWSNRLPETKEYIKLIDAQRNLKFDEIFYEMKGVFDEH
jgi:hypothetical protein